MHRLAYTETNWPFVSAKPGLYLADFIASSVRGKVRVRSMPEIMLRDLCRWDRRLSIIPPVGMSLDAALDRGVSWAVSVRAAPPLLPPLRGEELVVLPLRVLDQIELGETVSRDRLLSTLAQQKIAAILTEPGFTEDAIEHVPVMTLPTPFPHDAEGTLNRMITERRAELYRLGADLTRRLSQAAVDPRGISAILRIAAEVSARDVVLEDDDGNVVASSNESVQPGAQRLAGQARSIEGPLLSIEENGTEYLIVALASSGRSGYLSMRGDAGTLTEIDRLILIQTASMCAALLGQQPRVTSPDYGARERQVADLLCGRLATTAAAIARGHALGVNANDPVVIGLIDIGAGVASVPQARDLVARTLWPSAAENVASIDGVVGVLIGGRVPESAGRALLEQIERSSSPEVTVAFSQPLASVVDAPAGVRQARFALDLRRRGAIQQRVINCSNIDDLGVYALLYPLRDDPALDAFKTSLLGELEEYDRRRNSELIPTLEAYLRAGGALSGAADHLGIHRNTLSYRLQRISELTGRDLSDPEERLLLHIAVLALHMPPGRE